MVDSLPSPLESSRGTPEPTKDDLATRLDGLLEQYLDLLDQYTKLREDLSKTFSSGFFSLAQAQRTSTLGAARRYGEEYYDERMKAQRTISWQVDADSEELDCRVGRIPKKDDSKDKEEVSEQTTTEHLNNGNHADERKEQPDRENENDSKASEKPAKAARPKQDPATRDPLTWFGILVPPALRQTQTQFVKATEDYIPSLVAVASRLQVKERQIWAVRDELGVLSEYDREQIESENEPAFEAEQVKEQAKVESAKESQRSSRKPLTSRPAHSKSHLLKLGD